MKKLVSLILALVMVFALATTASAAYPNVVGTHGVNAGGAQSLTDGVADFTSGNANTTVAIEVTVGDIQSRYAVDVEYTDLEMSITGGSLTWDVNKLEYVSDGGVGLVNRMDNTITVKNYSDKSVWVTPNINDGDPNDGITIEYDASSQIKAKTEVAKATAASGGNPGKATAMTIVYNVTSTDWDAVAEYYAPKLADDDDGSMTVATIAITISKS